MHGNLPVLPSGSRFGIPIYQRLPTVGLIDLSLFSFTYLFIFHQDVSPLSREVEIRHLQMLKSVAAVTMTTLITQAV